MLSLFWKRTRCCDYGIFFLKKRKFLNIKNVLIKECGHGGICYECSLDVWRATQACFLCRLVIYLLFKVSIILIYYFKKAYNISFVNWSKIIN